MGDVNTDVGCCEDDVIDDESDSLPDAGYIGSDPCAFYGAWSVMCYMLI